jgi:hypothetical protein
MASGKRAQDRYILTRRVTKGPRKKRSRREPPQYTVADLARARDRAAAAERRIDTKLVKHSPRQTATTMARTCYASIMPSTTTRIP